MVPAAGGASLYRSHLGLSSLLSWSEKVRGPRMCGKGFHLRVSGNEKQEQLRGCPAILSPTLPASPPPSAQPLPCSPSQAQTPNAATVAPSSSCTSHILQTGLGPGCHISCGGVLAFSRKSHRFCVGPQRAEMLNGDLQIFAVSMTLWSVC